jgi:transposase
MSSTITLTQSQQATIAKLKKEEKSNKIYRRYLYLEMSNEGMTNLKIAKLIGVCNDTLTVWKQIYEEAGLVGLAELHYEGRRISKLAKHKETIINKIKSDNIATLKQLQDFLKTECQVEVEQSWLYRFCKKNSIYLIKRPV